jgi:hypothetical protein
MTNDIKETLAVVLILLLFLAFSGVLNAQPCRVLDPELQDGYAGACQHGLAHGAGSASGSAHYQGGFEAGRKHGHGVKTWPNGDRYEGEFLRERRHGFGVYRFGRGPWAGERYEGEFLDDRRHGHGVYRWGSGDLYDGPWREDVAVGPPTPMMQARARFEHEARAAVRAPGRKVCREARIGIAHREWLVGVVVAVAASNDRIGVRLQSGEITWDSPLAWLPCW